MLHKVIGFHRGAFLRIKLIDKLTHTHTYSNHAEKSEYTNGKDNSIFFFKNLVSLNCYKWREAFSLRDIKNQCGSSSSLMKCSRLIPAAQLGPTTQACACVQMNLLIFTSETLKDSREERSTNKFIYIFHVLSRPFSTIQSL